MGETATGGKSGTGTAVSPRTVAAASMAGTTLEYYDFAIFGVAAALVFPQVFFVPSDPVTGVLLSWVIFGVGYVARPLGAIIFGHLGDRVGRRAMLSWTLVLMGVSTLAIGSLPSYASIGLAAPILLAIARILQGIAFAGEWGGAVLLAFEHAPAKRRGFYASFAQIGLGAGILLGYGVFALLTGLISTEQLLSWGWRVPFLAGGLLVVLGWLVRQRLDESPHFKKVQGAHSVARFPLIEAIRTHPRQLLLSMGAVLGFGVPSQIFFIFAVGEFAGMGIGQSMVLSASLIGTAVLLFAPLAGAWSDRIGRRAVFIIGALLTGALGFFFFPLGERGDFVSLALAFALLSVPFCILGGVLPSLLSDSFATRVGYSGISVGYQFGTMFASFAPALAAGMLAGGLPLQGLVAISLAVLAVGCVCVVFLTKIIGQRGEQPVAGHEATALPPLSESGHTH